MHRSAHLLLGFVLVLLWGLAGGAVNAELLRIDRAILISGKVEREVTLPHRLDPADFDPDGSIVTYRLTFDLPTAIDGLQAIYISKLSLSGRLMRDGQPVWACGAPPLSDLRCLHRPHLVQLPAGFLNPGRNVLDLEVFADSRQMNGLTPVLVGSYGSLLHDHYLPARFLKIDLVRTLATFAGVAGLLSLAAGLAAPRERVFFVFAAAALLEAVASFVVLAVDTPWSRELTSWLVFNVRYVGVPLKLLLFYEAFGRLNRRDPLVIYFIVLMVAGPVAIALADSDRQVVISLYLLIVLGIGVTLVRMVQWTRAEPSAHNIVWTGAAAVIFACGMHDYLRLGGAAQFDGVYLLYYAFPIVMVIVGAMLFARMGMGLRVAQDFALALRREVADRTNELESALASIRNLEASALRVTRNIPIGTFILQTIGHATARYTFFSDRLRKMIDLPPDAEPPLFVDVEGRLHPDDIVPFRTGLRNAIDDKARCEMEYRMRSAENSWRWLRLIMLPQPGSAEPTVWDGVVIDVTDAREAEERLRVANAGLVEAAAHRSRMAERERLLLDMHDGFGSQLSSARIAVEQGALDQSEVARILLECSEDLRIMVDALGNTDGSLTDAMADFRYRSERRLSGTGIGIAWDIDIPEDTRLAPATILQILRILQEATNNALRHSGARRLRVGVRAAAGRLHVCLADNGRGLDGAGKRGRGMSNMHKRSREIGALLEITDTGAGTKVCLTMDLPDAR